MRSSYSINQTSSLKIVVVLVNFEVPIVLLFRFLIIILQKDNPCTILALLHFRDIFSAAGIERFELCKRTVASQWKLAVRNNVPAYKYSLFIGVLLPNRAVMTSDN